MSKVSARWVTEQLKKDQKASRVTVAKEHLGSFNRNENKFWNCIVAWDEMWVHYADLKQMHSQISGKEQVSKKFVSIYWQGYAGCFLRFTWNNTGSFYAKRLNCDC